jgi:hypothetical protein
MKRFVRPRELVFVALVVLAMVLAIGGPSQARAMGGHGVGGGHSEGHGGFEGHHDFDGHHGFEGRHFDHDGDGRGFGIGPVVPYYGYYPPAYGYGSPTYWYYCSSYGAYYPNVTSCPESWVPVPAS